MRKTFRFAAIGAVVILLQPCIALAAHDMTCHHPTHTQASWNFVTLLPSGEMGIDPKTEEEELNLLVPGAGGATSTSCSDAGGRALPILPPPDSFSAIELVPGAGQPGRYWLFEPVSQAFLEAHIRLSAELPNFTQPDGRPLLTQYNETGLDFLLQAARDFETGESLSASGGEILTWPAATLREMPAAFDPDELFPPDPARFPLYSGMAQVADIASFTVVPEPASMALLAAGSGLLLLRRVRNHKS